MACVISGYYLTIQYIRVHYIAVGSKCVYTSKDTYLFILSYIYIILYAHLLTYYIVHLISYTSYIYVGRTRSSAITASQPYASSTEATSQLSRLTHKQYHALWVYLRRCGLSWRSAIITVSYMPSRYVCVYTILHEVKGIFVMLYAY